MSGANGRRRLAALAVVVLALGAAAAVAVVALGSRGTVRTAPAAAVRRPAAAFRTVLPDGASFGSRDLAGTPTVVAFVIEDCASCIATLETLAALGHDGVRTVAVNVNVPPGRNPAAAAARLASFARRVGAASGTLFAADPRQRTIAAFGLRQIESFVIFDRRGRQIGRGVGLSEAQIREALKQA